jgi:hypothetical protein
LSLSCETNCSILGGIQPEANGSGGGGLADFAKAHEGIKELDMASSPGVSVKMISQNYTHNNDVSCKISQIDWRKFIKRICELHETREFQIVTDIRQDIE